MDNVLFAVLVRQDDEVRYGRSVRGGLMVYAKLHHAKSAAKFWLRERRKRGYSDPDGVRIVGISPEGELNDIWDDYEHTELL